MTILGLNTWLDVNMENTSTPAMEEGVKMAACFIAIVTGPCVNNDSPNDNPEDNAYFRREYCLMELRWARAAGKRIVCVVRAEDKDQVDSIFNLAPIEFRYLRENVVFFDRNDLDYQKIGIRQILISTGLRPTNYAANVIAKNKIDPKHKGGVHWTVVCDRTCNKSTKLASNLSKSMVDLGYLVFHGKSNTVDQVQVVTPQQVDDDVDDATSSTWSSGETKDNQNLNLDCKFGNTRFQINYTNNTTVEQLKNLISKELSIQTPCINLSNLKCYNKYTTTGIILKCQLNDKCLMSECKVPKILKISQLTTQEETLMVDAIVENELDSKTDAILVVLSDNVFTQLNSSRIRSARNQNVPVICVVPAADKTRIWPLSQNAPDDLKDLANDTIFHINDDDVDYLKCGVSKLLRKSGHLTIENGKVLDLREFEARNVAIEKLKENGLELSFLSQKLRDDSELVAIAVQNDGLALEHASKKCQNENDIVMAAIKQNSLALKFASESCQRDHDICMVAVTNNGCALEFARDTNKEIVFAALNCDNSIDGNGWEFGKHGCVETIVGSHYIHLNEFTGNRRKMKKYIYYRFDHYEARANNPRCYEYV